MGHTQDTPHMKISDLEDTITELQISCDGFAEQCSRLKAKIHNIEEGFERLHIYMMQGYSVKTNNRFDTILISPEGRVKYHCCGIGDLIDAILIGGNADEA